VRAGRIAITKQHLWRKNATVLLVGYRRTLGPRVGAAAVQANIQVRAAIRQTDVIPVMRTAKSWSNG
jgi:hypothetical protein